MKYIKLFVLSLSIVFTAILGDYVVFKSNYSSSQVFRAFSDSLTHATIGFLSAVLFLSYEKSLTNQAWLYNVIFCTIISSLIDLDHVIVAKSLYWKDITNTKNRGIFHCTTLWILFITILFIISYYYKKITLYILTWMFVIAFTSHHIRDASRRGFWVYPFGHTRAISNLSYVLCTAIIPSILSLLYKHMKPYILKYTPEEFVVV